MRLFTKLMCGVLILGCGGLFLLKKPDGQPVINIAEWAPNTKKIKQLISSTTDKFQQATITGQATITEKIAPDQNTSHKESKPSAIFRWKDDKGQWQFSDTPPSQHNAETIYVSGELNRDLSLPYNTEEKSSEEVPKETDKPSQSASLPISLSPDKISDLMESAKNLKQQMEKRNQQLENY